jgi:hypothetical protein
MKTTSRFVGKPCFINYLQNNTNEKCFDVDRHNKQLKKQEEEMFNLKKNPTLSATFKITGLQEQIENEISELYDAKGYGKE